MIQNVEISEINSTDTNQYVCRSQWIAFATMSIGKTFWILKK